MITNTLTIDGRTVCYSEGDTIMDAATRAGVVVRVVAI